MKEVILKLQEYENLLKDIQVYFYKSVECRVATQNEHIAWINKINDVIFTEPKNKNNSGCLLAASQQYDATHRAEPHQKFPFLQHHHRLEE